MNSWLLKLRRTEYEGYEDNLLANKTWNTNNNSLIRDVFVFTGCDELRHASLLDAILKKRGILREVIDIQPPSLYWDEMNNMINCVKSCAAVFHLGEELAAQRFEVIQKHPYTPEDVKWFVNQALPDERYHAEAFKRISSMGHIEEALILHNKTIEKLLKGK